jgi:acetoin utilization deacetylase AcuC-like enzyme
LSHEIGEGEGKGFTANVPFPHGTPDAAYADVVDELVAPLARAYKPDIILVSAGFDSHERDMLGGMAMTEAGFGYEAAVIRDLAAELCDGRVALFLEGGYDLRGITSSLVEVLRVLDGGDAPRPEGPSGPRQRQKLDETLEHLRPYWPDL